jgi:hypothetical protein
MPQQQAIEKTAASKQQNLSHERLGHVESVFDLKSHSTQAALFGRGIAEAADPFTALKVGLFRSVIDRLPEAKKTARTENSRQRASKQRPREKSS